MLALILASQIRSQDGVEVIDLRVQRSLPVQAYAVQYLRSDYGPSVKLTGIVYENSIETPAGVRLFYRWGGGEVRVNDQVATIVGVVDGPQARQGRQPDDLLSRLTTYVPPGRPLLVGEGWTWEAQEYPAVRIEFTVRGVKATGEGLVAVVDFSSKELHREPPAVASGEFWVDPLTGRAVKSEAVAKNVFFFDRRSEVTVTGRRIHASRELQR